MISTSTRRTLVALATTAALLPAAPALAQTATPTPTPAVAPTTSPTTPAVLGVTASANVIDFGRTVDVTVQGRPGQAVDLLIANRRLTVPRLIRTATLDADGSFSWTGLRPDERTTFIAVPAGTSPNQSPFTSVQVRRTVTIGVSQANGVYTFAGQLARAEAGVQVTIARLDSETKRVTGVASTTTDAAGRYTIRTALLQGFAGYYALTEEANGLDAGRSRLYGLIVNTRPGTGQPPAAQGLTLSVRRAGSSYSFEGVLSPARGGVPVTLARIVNGRLQGLAGGITEANGRYIITIQPPAGTYQFTALTANARSRNYGLVVPTATPGTACSPTAPRTSSEDSARCFFLAFVRNDRRLAANYATPAAAAEFLSWRGTGTPGWSWEGCGEPTVLTPSSGISCAYYDPMPGEVHGVLIEFGMARDFRVEAVGTVG